MAPCRQSAILEVFGRRIENEEQSVSRRGVASKAMKWVIWVETSRSTDQHWPAFKKWLLADRENWLAYMRAQREWSRWDVLEGLLSNDRKTRAWMSELREKRKAAARTHRRLLWLTLGVSLFGLLLM